MATVTRTAHPVIEHIPLPYRGKSARNDALDQQVDHQSGLGPPTKPPRQDRPIRSTPDAIAQSADSMRDTTRPTSPPPASTRIRMKTVRTIATPASARADVDGVLAGDSHDQHRGRHHHPERRQPSADGVQTRRRSAPGRSTAGKPWYRNHLSAAARCCVSGALMRSHRPTGTLTTAGRHCRSQIDERSEEL